MASNALHNITIIGMLQFATKRTWSHAQAELIMTEADQSRTAQAVARGMAKRLTGLALCHRVMHCTEGTRVWQIFFWRHAAFDQSSYC